jgi:Chaperone of endosialidase
MADSACYIELASNNGDFFTNSLTDDIMIRPQYVTQDILIGTSNGLSTLTITSNNVGIGKAAPAYTLDVVGDINFTGAFRQNGTPYIGSQWSNNSTNVFLLGSNVGIGTTVPTAPLHVTATSGDGRYNGIYVYNPSTNPNSNAVVAVRTNSATGGNPYFSWDVAGVSGWSMGMSNADSDKLVIKNTWDFTGDSNIMTLTRSGNVGIGTASPNYFLHAVSNATINGTSVVVENPNTGTGGYASLNARNSANQMRVGITGTGFTTSGVYLTNSGFVQCDGTNGISMVANNAAGSIRFYAGGTTEEMRVHSDGNVGIGTTTPAYKLDVNGTSRIMGSYTNGGSNLLVLDNQASARIQFVDEFVGLPCGIASYGTGNGLGIYAGTTIGFFTSNLASSNALQRMIVTQAGDIGIGTTSPSYKLDVQGTTGITNAGGKKLQFDNDTSTNRHIVLFETANNDHQYYGFGINNSILRYQVSQANANHVFYAGASTSASTELMRIQGAGNVGIGTASPSYKLDVSGVVRANDVIGSTWNTTNFTQLWNDGAIMYKTGNYLRFGTVDAFGAGTNWIERMRIHTDGNVGIGTTSPSYKLHVYSNSTTNTVIAAENVNTSSWAGVVARNSVSTVNGGIRMGILGTAWSTGGIYHQNGGFLECDQSNGISIAATSNNGSLRFYAGGTTEVMRVNSNQNVGIGTTSPLHKLDVNGYANIDQTYFFNDSVPFGSTSTNRRYALLATLGANQGYALIEGLCGGHTSGGPQGKAKFSIIIDARDGNIRGNAANLTSTNTGHGIVVYRNNTTNDFTVYLTAQHFTRYNVKVHATDNVTVSTSLSWSADTAWTTPSGTTLWFDSITHTPVSSIDSDFYMTAAATSVYGTTTLISGNFGVGTSNPLYKLDVSGSGRFTTGTVINNNQSLSFLDSGGTARSIISVDSGNTFRINGASSSAAVFINPDNSGSNTAINFNNSSATQIYNGNTATLTVTGCNVSIGTISPGRKLHVNNTGADSYIRISGDFGQQQGIEFFDTASRWLIYKPASTSDLRFWDGTANRISLSNNGNVGIGTITPAYTLDVNGQIRSYVSVIAGLNSGQTSASEGTMEISGNNGSTGNWRIWKWRVGGSSNTVSTYNTHRLRLLDNDVERLTVDDNGNLGIGISNPTYKLDVSGSIRLGTGSGDTTSQLFINTSDTDKILLTSGGTAGSKITHSASWSANFLAGPGNSATGQLTFQTSTASGWTERMRIVNNGNVGIGTTSPSFPLDVNGSINTSGMMLLTGGSNCVQITGSDPGDMIVRAYGTAGDRYGMGQYAAGVTRLFTSSTFSGSIRLSAPTDNVRTGAAPFTDYVTILAGTNANAGNVGIGTTTPANKLDVNGSGRFIGGITACNSTFHTSNEIGISPNAYNSLLVWDDQKSTTTFTGTLSGNATRDTTNGYIQFTSATNAQTGNVVWQMNPGNSCSISFDYFAGGGTGADGLSVAIYSSSSTPTDTGSGYNIFFDEYNQNGTNNDRVQTFAAGTAIDTWDLGAAGYLDNSTWKRIDIKHIRGTIMISIDGTTRLRTINDIERSFIWNTNTYVGIGGRTGGANNIHRIRNLRISKIDTGIWSLASMSNTTNIYYPLGNVGIGTTNPAYPLDVVNVTAANAVIRVGDSTNQSGRLMFGNSSHGVARGASISGATDGNDLTVHTAGNGSVTLATAGGEGLRVNSSANVGIGTTSPATKLHVVGSCRVNGRVFVQDATSSSGSRPSQGFYVWDDFGFGMELQNQHGGWNTAFITRTNDGGFLWKKSDGTFQMMMTSNNFLGIGTSTPSQRLDVNGNIKTVGDILISSSGRLSIYNDTGPLQLRSGNANTLFLNQDNNGSVSMVVGGGNVGVATTSPSYKFHVVGDIYATGDIIGFSDVRLKSNITIIDSALSKIHKLNGYTFNIQDDEKPHTGLIAQEVLEVLPEAVHQEKKADGTDGYYSLAYGNMAGLFVEAIKEIDNKYKSQITDLQEQVSILKNEIDILKNKYV